ncbi:hypothetical protein CLV59_111179 [Chitinophaga dinghuensis]|uniref:Uncharacterized protein n=1 Tax=Chitinophaga dinghuensis TaxID=1539050 RepID=A0A327VMN0_9BACT|nr:hypothetical protein [Chitinophaga dinghuensis]RAJ74059.1 hypothetical protein CLV59_111179 [Chitinophaga dinghuensis]
MKQDALIQQNPRNLLLITWLVYLLAGIGLMLILIFYHPFRMVPHQVVIQTTEETTATLNTGQLQLDSARHYNMKVAVNGRDYFIPLVVKQRSATGDGYQIQLLQPDTLLQGRKNINGIIYIQEHTKITLLKNLLNI